MTSITFQLFKHVTAFPKFPPRQVKVRPTSWQCWQKRPFQASTLQFSSHPSPREPNRRIWDSAMRNLDKAPIATNFPIRQGNSKTGRALMTVERLGKEMNSSMKWKLLGHLACSGKASSPRHRKGNTILCGNCTQSQPPAKLPSSHAWNWFTINVINKRKIYKWRTKSWETSLLWLHEHGSNSCFFFDAAAICKMCALLTKQLDLDRQ